MKLVVISSVLILLNAVMIPAEVPDLEKEKAELLRIHKEEREAHFNTDVERLLAHHAEEFISVFNGKIKIEKKQQTREFFQKYFENSKYYEWNDMESPIVRISTDASMAWVIVRVKVRRTQKDGSGNEKETKFIYAGIMTYEKQNDKWIAVANVSTFEPQNS
ncbi:nuclear transport factor 2 family protein [bacterium]|nr:nuclear transport factor 2 family protein [bacterium]